MKRQSSQGLGGIFRCRHAAKERKEDREPVERVSSRASIFRTASADCLRSRRRLKARCSVDSPVPERPLDGNPALSTHSTVSQRTGAKGGKRTRSKSAARSAVDELR